MACRGVHFAIEKEQYEKLMSAKNDDDVIEIIQEEIEEEWDQEWLHETDKAWDAIHRCLTDGRLEWDNGKLPLKAAVIGGELIHKGEDYIVSVVAPEKVPEVAKALQAIDENTLRNGYNKIKESNYGGEIGEEDFEYTKEWFKGLPELFSRAASTGRAIVFSVDQ